MNRSGSRRILITGATGAIGQALAKYYAVEGAELTLLGRNQNTLIQLQRECEQAGASVDVHCLELADISTVRLWLDCYLSKQVPDLFIANAGMNINIGPQCAGEEWEQMESLLDLNVKATLLMTGRIAKAMKSRSSGQIALISSLAGYHGLPVTPSYSASKAGVKAYGEAIRGWLANSGVGVTVVMPGYVKSNMCDAMPGPKPFLWQPERAARVIARGVEKNRARISFPFPLNLGTWFLSVLPPVLAQYFLRLLNYSGR